MKRKIIITALIIILIIAVAAFYFIYVRRASKAPTNGQLILFYGIGCPHCVRVEKFLHEKPALTVPLTRKEVYYNRANLRDLIDKARRCGGIQNGGILIPLLWQGHNQCVIGDKKVMDYLNKFIKK
jgi:hypothetical protein